MDGANETSDIQTQVINATTFFCCETHYCR